MRSGSTLRQLEAGLSPAGDTHSVAPGKLGFFAELKRRNVLRAAVLYIGAVWALSQGISQLSGPLHLPNWVTVWFLVACAIGFPFWVAFAWFYEFTPQGIQRESEVAPSASVTHSTARKLDFAIIAVLVVAVALLASGYFVRRHAPVVAATAAAAISAQSIAVLPFENLSNDKDNEYFVAGMQDLILTKLADIGSLKVIARTSTQSYGSHPENLTLVGQQLGVATILEGSVQKAGNEVLINVQLIDAKTDSHIWAESYTRTLTNIFGVEGEVAEKVATALNAKLTQAETARVSKIPTHNTAAYDAFLQGEYYAQRAVATALSTDFGKAEAYYRQAVAQDPRFALAWARLAYVSAAQTWMTFTGDQQPVLAAQAKAALGHALALAPNSPDVHLAQAWYDHWIAHDLKAALTAFETVLTIQPQNAQALFGAGVVQTHLGKYRDAVELFRNAADRSPKDATLLAQLGVAELDVRDYTRAQQTLRRALALDPDSAFALSNLVNSYYLAGNPDGAKKVLDATSTETEQSPDVTVTRVMIALQRRDYTAARKAAARIKPGGRYSEAFANVQRGDVEWAAGDRALARQYYQRALPVYENEVKRFPDKTQALSGLSWLLMRLGNVKEAMAGMQQAIHIASERGDRNDVDVLHWDLAMMLAQLGKGDQAATLLDDLLSRPSGVPVTVAALELDPSWDPIRHDPVFQALLKKYAKSSPAVTYGNPLPASSSGTTAH